MGKELSLFLATGHTENSIVPQVAFSVKPDSRKNWQGGSLVLPPIPPGCPPHYLISTWRSSEHCGFKRSLGRKVESLAFSGGKQEMARICVVSKTGERQLVGRKQLQNQRASAHLQVEEALTHGAAGREGTERFDLGFDLGNLR